MTAARYLDPNTQILRAFGITQQRVVAADLSLRPGKPPRFMVDCIADPHTMLHEVLAFDLVPRPCQPEPTPALDLDAMCAAAQQRIADAADNAAYRAKCEHLGESKLIRTRLDQALLRRRTKVSAALAILDLSPLVNDLGRIAASGGLFGGSLGGLASPGLTKALADFPRFNPVSFTLGGERK